MGLLIMAQQGIPNSNATTHSSTQQQKLKQEDQQLLKPMFHDFLGMKPGDSSSPVILAPKASNCRLSDASASASASLGGSSGGGRGPFSTTSDLGSERQAGNHLEGVPYYGPRTDISGPEISNRLLGSKRSNSDSSFMASSRDRVPHSGPDSLDSSHLMKMLRGGPGGERTRRSNDDEAVFATQLRPTSGSHIFQPLIGGRIDANSSKWERPTPMNLGAAVQYPSRGGHLVPFMHQLPSNRFRDVNPSPNNISQSAADEGSRTGIKGAGILSSINASSGAPERNSHGVLPSGSRQKSVTNILEPEPSTSSRHGFTSASRQMTIFYGGHAHVFDDVHPNKADVIMALAGSNGGSWSTTYSVKPTVKPGSETHTPSGEVEAATASNIGLLREYRGRLNIPGTSSQAVAFADRMMTPGGGHQGSNLGKDSRNPIQAAEPSSKDKNDL